MVIMLCLWPLYQVYLMIMNYDELETTKVKNKFSSLYIGIKVKDIKSLMYSGVFSARRMLLVLPNILLSMGSVANGTGRDLNLFKVLCLLVV